jgi:alkylation response protein AidB-like acyl-CoA dehydrogenase
MGFDVTPELQAKIDTVRDFVRTELYPLEPRFLTRPFDEMLPTIKELRQKVKAMGMIASHMPRDVGGGGLHFLQFARISEELGKSPLGLLVFNSQAPDAGNMELMYKHVTPEQRERFLLPLVAGDVRSCFTMTEPGHAGSNPVDMSVTAVKDGDDYLINGKKWFSSAIDNAGFAIAMTVTNPQAPPHERATMFFVPLPNPGLKILRKISVMGETGHDFFTHCEIEYQDCRVPAANMLGGLGQAFRLAQDRLGPGRIHHCMRWIGICERALGMMVDRARTRKIGHDRTLGDMQSIQNWIAESRAEIDAARLLVLNAAEAIEKKGAHNARVEISCIKIFVPQVLLKVIDRAIQTHGALGMTDDTILSWWYRHERGSRIYDGPDEVHKVVIARALLKENRG